MLNRITKVLIPFLAAVGLLIMAPSTVSAAYQELYVDGGLVWVDYGTYQHGPINSPYLTINEALSALDTDGGSIYVAEGTYTEDINLVDLDNITIAGGYNGGQGEPNPFTVQDTDANQTTIMGQVTGSNISGSLVGLTFGGQSGINSFIDINLAGSGYNFTINDCRFTLASVLNYFVKISAAGGSSGLITNNVFTLLSSDQSIVETQGGNGTVVRNNHFNGTQSTNGSYGIIRATDGAKVMNNLIQDSGSNNRVAIRISNAAEVYNNTIVGGSASTAAIATSGADEHNVYNNLVSDVTGPDFVWAASADQMNNSSVCDPDFAGGSGPEAFKLGANSTCIDAGAVVSAVADDFFGTSRPSGGGYDIGFNEFYVTPECGNGFVELSETCDDGNLVDGDGCSAMCEIETAPTPGVCGDGTLNTGEACDDGNTVNGDGCSALCEEEVVVDCGDWLDIDPADTHYGIAVYLCENGEIVKGDAFGNLRIDDKLTRAELLAMAFRAREYEGYGVVDTTAQNCFPDVTNDWYAKYFCTAKDAGFVQGYPDGEAKPGNNVLLGEGLKMFLGALEQVFTIDTGDCWYCTMVEDADLNDWIPFTFTDPTEVGPLELSRRYAMDMLYRMLTN